MGRTLLFREASGIKLLPEVLGVSSNNDIQTKVTSYSSLFLLITLMIPALFLTPPHQKKKNLTVDANLFKAIFVKLFLVTNIQRLFRII